MDPLPAGREDDLTGFERRLAGWRPAPASSDADAVLFAAGLAAGRRGWGRRLWPTACVLLAVQAAGLGAWALTERARRQALETRLSEPVPAPVAPAAAVPPDLPPPSDVPSPEGYLRLLRAAEQDPGRWLAPPPSGAEPSGPPPAEPATLRVNERDRLLDL